MNAKLEMSDEVADRRVVEQKEKKAAALINWKVGILVYKCCFFVVDNVLFVCCFVCDLAEAPKKEWGEP